MLSPPTVRSLGITVRENQGSPASFPRSTHSPDVFARNNMNFPIFSLFTIAGLVRTPPIGAPEPAPASSPGEGFHNTQRCVRGRCGNRVCVGQCGRLPVAASPC